MESFSCDANLVIFVERLKNIRVDLPARGGEEIKKRMALVSHPLRDSIVNATIW